MSIYFHRHSIKEKRGMSLGRQYRRDRNERP